ncbi:RepFIB replication protein A [Photorhabdus australis subsp. thailandensis]|uniref:RepFIB replication protein A n=1 Tax=Photorhabdus australis subsp. thailandensis TaxID=2805096 RepID=A0A1C0U8B5_9GAMM|nr:RepB family plasmid replication initiator protein [Photorhabdus australis]OCQ54116.1 RepFIB replication protein A [Photorhabdus australis subsp. thailandensis]
MVENFNKNNEIYDMFWEIEKGSGELVSLVPNNSNTIQPVALMRLGLFVPTLKSTKRGHKGEMSSMDATAELRQLTIVKTEGYENIHITGARLDMDNDFKTWVGIIHSFAKYKVIGASVTLSFVDFIKLCGIPSSRSSKRLRERLDASLRRIATNTLSFRSQDKSYHTHLVQSAYYDMVKDTVTIQADPKIFELYQFDRKVLLQLRAINELSRKESAQALYTYIESLPPSPAPISLARLRARLNLKSRVTTQNATVRKAMEQLKSIGYLDCTEIKRGNSVYFIIHARRPTLKTLKSSKRALKEKKKVPQEELIFTELTLEELELLEKIRADKITKAKRK